MEKTIGIDRELTHLDRMRHVRNDLEYLLRLKDQKLKSDRPKFADLNYLEGFCHALISAIEQIDRTIDECKDYDLRRHAEEAFENDFKS